MRLFFKMQQHSFYYFLVELEDTQAQPMPWNNEKRCKYNRMAPTKTYLDKVIEAIREDKDPKGSSRASIKKFLKTKYNSDNTVHIKKALKKGLATKKLCVGESSQRFKVANETYKAKDDGFRSNDIKVGDGKVAKKGDTVSVKYKGTLESGYCFDQGTITFTLYCGEVIKGWDRGVEGMKVNGKRKLVCPPHLGYGKRGSPPDIPGNATLYFNLKLLKVN